MKAVLILVACLLPFSFSTGGSKMKLLCRKWQQVGIRPFGREYTPVDRSMAEVLVFSEDGSYTEELDVSMHIKGQWRFNSDSTKLAFAITEMNGTPMSDLSLSEAIPADSIILLTADTLIYGRLANYGKEKIYGHEDSYFVRAE
jgi:hypothetical protein